MPLVHPELLVDRAHKDLQASKDLKDFKEQHLLVHQVLAQELQVLQVYRGFQVLQVRQVLPARLDQLGLKVLKALKVQLQHQTYLL